MFSANRTFFSISYTHIQVKMDAIVNITEKSTEQFIQFFYPSYDTQRQVSADALTQDGEQKRLTLL